MNCGAVSSPGIGAAASGVVPPSNTAFSQDIDAIAQVFSNNGTLLYSSQDKQIWQCGEYVLKQIILTTSQMASVESDEVKHNQKQKRESDFRYLQHEFAVAQRWWDDRPEHLHIVAPLAFGVSTQRCVLLSPYMDRRDAWFHLIQKNLNLFKLVSEESMYVTAMPDDQKYLLILARNILFGAMKMLVQVSQGLRYMHEELGIAHNDLKPDNIFAHAGRCANNIASEDDDGVDYYLADFGYTKQVGFKSRKEAKKFYTAKMENYLAPEILEIIDDKRRDEECVAAAEQAKAIIEQQAMCGELEIRADVFALGVSLFQILFQANPFQFGACHASDSQYALLEKHPAKFWMYVEKQLTIFQSMTNVDSLKDLLAGMLCRDQKRRLTITEVLEHPWLQDMRNYLYSNKVAAQL